MKKIILFSLLTSLLLLTSCGNNPNAKKKADSTKAVNTEQQILTADLKIKMDSLAASINTLKMIPVLESVIQGKIKLSEKEKMQKPNYLLPVSKARKLVTLSQKYRAVMMYRIDLAVSELYGMPTTDYKQTVARLLVDINNPIFAIDINEELKKAFPEDIIKQIYNKEVENGTINLFWEGVTAGIVEQVYILSKNIDKFIGCFDDTSASDVSYRFILVQEALKSLAGTYPEMGSLNTVLSPLYTINAINVAQLRDQLFELKGQIEIVRNTMLDLVIE